MPEVPLREIEGLDGVERRVGEMWSELARDGKTVLRACKMNLLVVADPADEVARLLEDLGQITDMEPGRVIVVSRGDRGTEASLTPWIAAHCHLGPGGHPVCSEQIVLEVSGEAHTLVPEAVRRVLVSDMPVYVWWRAPLTEDVLLQPIVEAADRFIVNSAAAGTPGRVLPLLAELTVREEWSGNVGDLAWVRTEPWREIVASMFDEPAALAELPHLRSLHVECSGLEDACGSTGLYVAGWLASRLGWTVEARNLARRADGGAVDIALTSGPSTVHGRITRVRLESERGGVFDACRTHRDGTGVRVLGEARLPRLRRVEPLGDLALLHGELQRDGRDPVFEAALRAAAALSGSPAGP